MTIMKVPKNTFAAKNNKTEEPKIYATGKGKRRETMGDDGRPRETMGDDGKQERQREATWLDATGKSERQREATEASSCAQVLASKAKCKAKSTQREAT